MSIMSNNFILFALKSKSFIHPLLRLIVYNFPNYTTATVTGGALFKARLRIYPEVPYWYLRPDPDNAGVGRRKNAIKSTTDFKRC